MSNDDQSPAERSPPDPSPSRRTLIESWSDYVEGEPEERAIHSAVDDALSQVSPANVEPLAAPASPAVTVEEALPPPPDRSGSFTHWADEDHPEFAHDVVSGESSSGRWPIAAPAPFPVDALAQEEVEEPKAAPPPLRIFHRDDDEPLLLAPIQVSDVPDDDDDDELLGLVPRRDLGSIGVDPLAAASRAPGSSSAALSLTRSASASASAMTLPQSTRLREDDEQAAREESDELEIVLTMGDDDEAEPAASRSAAAASLSAASLSSASLSSASLSSASRSSSSLSSTSGHAWLVDDTDPAPEFFREPLAEALWRRPDGLVGAELLGRYRLLRALSEGSIARVYLADDLARGRVVALKILGIDHPAQSERARLFRNEARAMARLDHPGVVRILDVGVTPSGLSYFAMEHLEGETLAEHLARVGPLPWRRALAMVRQALAVTHAVHASGRCHRTIDPRKCFVLADADAAAPDTIKLLDVGLSAFSGRLGGGALSSRDEGVLGVVEYIAPEVASGGLPEQASDLYALGVLFYELVTGRPPFVGDTLLGVLKQHLYDAPLPPRGLVEGGDLPETVESLIVQLLAKEPRARPPSTSALAAALASAEARAHEVVRAKTLLVAVDASMWGDEGEPPPARAAAGAPHEPPISPLTDDDRPGGRAEAERQRVASRVAVAPAAAPTKSAPAAATQGGAAPAGPSRSVILVVAAVAVAVIFLIYARPSTPEPEPTIAARPAVNQASSANSKPAKERDEAPASPALPTKDPSEGVVPDPSEGVALDPSEGVALDPSEGAPPVAEPAVEPEPEPEPAPVIEPVAEPEPEPAPVIKPEPEPTKKPKPKPESALSEATVRAKLSGLRGKVSSKCGQSGGCRSRCASRSTPQAR
jgi:hypothetical protein